MVFGMLNSIGCYLMLSVASCCLGWRMEAHIDMLMHKSTIVGETMDMVGPMKVIGCTHGISWKTRSM